MLGQDIQVVWVSCVSKMLVESNESTISPNILKVNISYFDHESFKSLNVQGGNIDHSSFLHTGTQPVNKFARWFLPLLQQQIGGNGFIVI